MHISENQLTKIQALILSAASSRAGQVAATGDNDGYADFDKHLGSALTILAGLREQEGKPILLVDRLVQVLNSVSPTSRINSSVVSQLRDELLTPNENSSLLRPGVGGRCCSMCGLSLIHI